MYSSGPLSQNISINGGQGSRHRSEYDPSHGNEPARDSNVPKEVHTLNDASGGGDCVGEDGTGAGGGLVYVISDGKEYGSRRSTQRL